MAMNVVSDLFALIRSVLGVSLVAEIESDSASLYNLAKVLKKGFQHV